MPETQEKDVIDIGKIIKKVWARRKLFLFKVWPVTFVLSCLIIICVPRYYTSEARLAPELGGNMSAGGLGSLAATFGLDLSNMEGGDAITPMLYPDLMEDNAFVTSLFNIRVKSADGEIDTDYYTYLRKHQKKPWWGYVTGWIKDLISSLLPQKDEQEPASGTGEKSPYWLSETDNGVAETVRGNIQFNIDKQTLVISISATAQDPLVAKILADSVQQHLQQFITDYRTSKARNDERHYQQLLEEATVAYQKSCEAYARKADANSNIVLNRYRVEQENLEKEMQMKYATLQTVATQLQMASAKVQERTPAFTVIKGANVPIRAAGPKRMLFVLGMLIFVTFAELLWITRKELHF